MTAREEFVKYLEAQAKAASEAHDATGDDKARGRASMLRLTARHLSELPDDHLQVVALERIYEGDAVRPGQQVEKQVARAHFPSLQGPEMLLNLLLQDLSQDRRAELREEGRL